ncbi:MAG: hypothetical protein V7723_17895 [Sneathiella sp.]|uniref:hypothetical protein n=1 Tax=Sneathiella sp. TaxID=1964365 RepID=UPI0030014FB7
MKKISIIMAVTIGILGSTSLALAQSNQTESQDTKSHSMMQDSQSKGEAAKSHDMMNMMSKMEPMMKQCGEMMESMKSHMKSEKDA